MLLTPSSFALALGFARPFSKAVFQNSLDRFGERFVQRVFTPVEQAKAERRPFTKAGTLAKRFAAKEALAKALGTGMRAPVTFSAIRVTHDARGRPAFAYAPELQAWLRTRALGPCHLSVSDEVEYAVAFVVMERA